MKTDAPLKADVAAELAWDPAVDSPRVGVSVHNGVVTLAGEVNSMRQKLAAEKAARRVAGVRGVAVDLVVRVPGEHARSDTEIAEAAVNALRWHSTVPDGKVKVVVDDGWITLTGEVDWGYQRMSAEHCVQWLRGVRGVTNDVTLKPRASAENIGTQIAAAFARHARRQAAHLKVEVDGSVVTLRGKVESLAEHEAAVGTAFAAQGVSRVVDRLEVEPQ